MLLPCFSRDKEVFIDETSKGTLFSSVFAAAVIWDPNLTEEIDPFVAKIKDSKKTTKKQRPILRDYIEKHAIDFAVCFSDEKVIDEINILHATYLTMHKCLDKLTHKFDLIIVDGNSFKPYHHIDDGYMPHECIVDGDNKYIGIAAASILAKVYHDEYIRDMCKTHPYLQERYDLLNNMGYGTKKHIDGIKKYGCTEFHRKTFTIKVGNERKRIGNCNGEPVTTIPYSV